MDLVINRESLAGSPVAGRYWLSGMLLCLAAGCAAALTTWQVAFAPLVVGIALVCIFKPDWGLYFLAASLFFPYAIIEEPHFYPADIILFLVVAGFWLRRAQEGKSGFTRTLLDWPIVVWLGIMALSLVNAHDLTRGIINWLRHVQLFLLYYSLAGFSHRRHSQKIIELFIGIALVFAAVNIVPFIESGGTERIFGIPRISFSGILIMCATYVAARVCHARGTGRMIGWLILLSFILLGQIANQSRAALALTAFGMVVALFMTRSRSSRNGQIVIRRRVSRLLLSGALITVCAGILAYPLLESLIDRYRGVGNAAATLNFRYFLWKTAWAMYCDHPFLGIGLGQIQVWQNFAPALRLDPVGIHTFGLGSHNTFIKYLAETGTIGIIGFVWLFVKSVKISFGNFNAMISGPDVGHRIGLYAIVIGIAARALVEGHTFYAISGITTALFWGLALNSTWDKHAS